MRANTQYVHGLEGGHWRTPYRTTPTYRRWRVVSTVCQKTTWNDTSSLNWRILWFLGGDITDATDWIYEWMESRCSPRLVISWIAIDADPSNHCTHLSVLCDDFASPPDLFAQSLGVSNAFSWPLHHQHLFGDRY